MDKIFARVEASAAIYIAVLVLIQVMLTFLVIYGRYRYKVGIGDGGNAAMARLIRVHGNFVEFFGPAAALQLLLPLTGASATLVHCVGGPILIGRILHAIGLAGSAGTSFGRMAGMVLTVAGLVIGAVAVLLRAF